MTQTRGVGATVALLGALGACAGGEPGSTGATLAPPARPAGAIIVTGGLQAAVDAAAAGTALALPAGRHAGPLRVDKPLTIWGPPDAVITSAGTGSTVDVTAPGVSLLGFTVDGSGGRFDLTDAAVRVHADDAVIAGLTIEHALFGVLVEKARGVTVRGNTVRGNGEPSIGLRGDGIRLWEVRDSTVVGNHVLDSRDMVIWYSSGNRIADNVVERSRYGTHLMYSHDNELSGNRYLANVVGVFLMYSRRVTLRDNLLAFSTGAAGLGLGLKESGDVMVSGNEIVHNSVGIHSDNSPLDRDARNRFEYNVIRSCDAAVAFNGIAERTSFVANVFRDNLVQVRIDGGRDAASVEFAGNDFDDYRGYDLDDDGTGDVPYELRSLSTQLIGRYPDLAFFRGTPTLSLVDLSSQVMPIFRPRTVLVDRTPATRDPRKERRRAR